MRDQVVTDQASADQVGLRARAQRVAGRLAALHVPAAAVIFGVALLTRLLWASVPINIDEDLWIRRGPSFLAALLDGHLADTYLRHHPGVTNMWLIGGALAARYGLRGLLPTDDVARQSASLVAYLGGWMQASTIPAVLYANVRWLFALVTAGCLAGIYALSRRLFGRQIALLAAAILLLEPFFLAYQRSITTDANQANFTWLALLSFLLYFSTAAKEERPSPRWLLCSGLCYGLAVLSKISALLSLPAFGLVALAHLWGHRRGRGWQRPALHLLLWGIVAVVIVFLLWPALWVDPWGTLVRLRGDLGSELDGHKQFFLGQPTSAPGAGFYPLVLAFRLSPLLLLGSLLGIAVLAIPSLRRRLDGSPALIAIGLNLAIVFAGLSSSATKMDRYIVPLLPGLALLAAAGLWTVACRWNERRAAGQAPVTALIRPPALVAAIVVLQLAVLLPHYPYNLTYYNPLLGGPAQADKLLMIGNGELLDRAAAWIHEQPRAAGAAVASWYATAFAPYYHGPATDVFGPLTDGTYEPLFVDARYVVLYANQFQRQLAPVPYFAVQKPLHVVAAHGLDYAAIYAGPAVDPADLASVASRTALDFGGKARLVGYDLETSQVSAGEPAVLALYWQSVAAFDAPDYYVHLEVRDAAGNRLSQANSVPVGGYLPVSDWKVGQIVRDVQQVRVLPGTPPGEYRLELSLYSPQRDRSLDIRDQNGPRGVDVALATFAVTRPAAALSPTADLGAQRLAPAVALAPGGHRLVGYDWPQPKAARAGDAIPTSLVWQAGAQAGEGQVFLQLSSGGQRWRRTHGHPLGGSYPAGTWTPGELVRDTWDALLPADAPGGRYHVEMVAAAGSGDVPLLDLGEIDIQGRDHTFDLPHPGVSQTVELGNFARLLGYDAPAAARPGTDLGLTLYWQARGEAERGYVRFVHVLDGAGQIVAQADSVPAAGALPTTTWIAGEVLTDAVAVHLPAGLAPGSYRLAVGLYDPTNNQRLQDPAGQDRVLLTQTVEVR